MIEVNQLTKKYGDHYAIKDVSFKAEPGKIYGFLGPNGAGKSTTMNIATGYIGATSGSVVINGHDIFKEPEAAKKEIGYLPEIPPVYNDMTVFEYLMFVAELKSISKATRKIAVAEVMERTKITDMKNRLIKNLSKGYRQRVGLSAALLSYPEVIILDEPSVGLDPEQIIEMRELISSLRDGHTVILSSHILSEVQAVCDYVFIIVGGHMVEEGSISELCNKYESESLEDVFLKVAKEAALTDMLASKAVAEAATQVVENKAEDNLSKDDKKEDAE